MNNKLSKKELNYWEQWQEHHDRDAGDYLVTQYLPLVDYVTERLMISLPKTVDKDEIRSLALEGLLDALDKFDLKRNLKFETYATWRIKGAVIDGLRQSDWLPRTTRENVKKIEEAYRILEQTTNHSVSDEDVAQYLGITKAELNKTVSDAALSVMLSIDEPTSDDEGNHVGKYNTIINEHAESPERYVMDQVIKDALKEAIDRLPEREKIVISLCYFEELKLKEIAEVLDVSVSRVSQLHSKALLRLHTATLSIHDNY